jgi:hypothetical protein
MMKGGADCDELEWEELSVIHAHAILCMLLCLRLAHES